MLAATPVLFGTFLRLPSLPVARLLMAHTQGAIDFVVIDIQHQAFNPETLGDMLHLAHLSGVKSLVRLGPHDFITAELLMDLGAEGIIFPLINSRREAERAVATCRYSPTGTRSVGGLSGLMRLKPDDPLCVIQIEHQDAMGVLNEILDVPGIDALLPGPVDLARSFGHEAAYGRIDEARQTTADALAQIESAADARGIPRMQFYPNGASACNARRDGCKFAIVSSDATILAEGLLSQLTAAKPTT